MMFALSYRELFWLFILMGGDPLKTLGPHNSFPVVSRANTVVDYVDGGGVVF